MPHDVNIPGARIEGVDPKQFAAGRGFIERIASSPILVDPERLAEMTGHVAQFVNHERFADFVSGEFLGQDDYWPEPGTWRERYRPYNVVNGVLQIPVMGALINRMGDQVGRSATGYTYIDRAFARGQADPAVKGIAFIIDTGGGEAAGNFELTDKLYTARGNKSVTAFVADHAYSGGYSIATAADEIVVTRSGGTGSVGVVTLHVEMSALLEKMGVKATFIKAGKYKVDGNRFEPLTETAKARTQARIDKIYGVFTSTVARNRDMEEDAVRETEALTYDADESIQIGFADRIGELDDELAAFETRVAQRRTGVFPMTTKTENTTPPVNVVSQADHEAAVAAARTEGAQAERERFAAVQASEHYAGREAQATHMLSKTNLSSADIIDVLQAAPVAPKAQTPAPAPAAAAAPRNHFQERMDAEGGPQVGAGGDDDEQIADTPQARTSRLMAAHRAATGAKAPARQ